MEKEIIKKIAGIIKIYLPEDTGMKYTGININRKRLFVKKLSDLFEREEKERLGRVTTDKYKHDLDFNPSQFKKECGVE